MWPERDWGSGLPMVEGEVVRRTSECVVERWVMVRLRCIMEIRQCCPLNV